MKPFFQSLSVLLPLFRREAVANDATVTREHAVANAWTSDTVPEEDTGWFKVSPYGIFPGKTPGRPQHFGEAQARAVVSEFNSVLGRLGRLFRGVPIYRGHPDVDPTIWTDDRRLGKITALEARPDGLWARAEWNSLGAENQREGYWIYPSPRWDAPAGRERFEPDRLLSVGLTNTPRIPDSEPVANSQETQDDKTQDTREQPTNTEPTEPTMDPKLIREKLGLAPEATDEEVFAKIDSLLEATARTEEAAAEKQAAEEAAAKAAEDKAEMENALAARTAEANAKIIDLALHRGCITAASRPQWESKLADPAQREDAANALSNMKPLLNTAPLRECQTREDRAKTADLREAVANAVSELEKKGVPYTEAWSTVKKRPEFAAYFQ